jgi:tRNA(Ile)-lysidine synthase
MITPNSFLEHLKQICPNHQSGILVAISGGADSVCLLHLLSQCGVPIQAAHVNYGLRANDSELDMEFVIQLCSTHNIPLHIKTVTKGELEIISNNTQEAARTLRYNFFHDLIQSLNLQYIATGHHSDDQAETVLYNIIRGKFKTGLAGIPQLNQHIIRPLLVFGRKDIEAYLLANKLEFRTDLSNITNDYTRNKIRNNILPLLENINPKASIHLNQLAAHARFANFAIADWVTRESKNFIIHVDHNCMDIYPEKIECSDEFKPHVLHHILQNFGFNFLQCVSISKPANHNNGTKFESEKFVLFKHNQLFHLEPRSASIKTSIVQLQTFPTTIACAQSNYRIDLIEWNNQFDLRKINGWCIKVNADDEIMVADIEPGDRMIPLGMSGFKKVSDILIDKKVPLYQKLFVKKITLNGEICALIPIGIDERYKVNDRTQTVLCIMPIELAQT